MTNKKSTKRALLVSAMAMVICFTMLLGTTFAWFTDFEESTGNVITAGKLEVKFEYSENGKNAYSSAENVQMFKYTNWEPGYADIKQIKLTNDGSLDFNYKIRINGTIATDPSVIDLADVIEVYVVKAETIARNDLKTTNTSAYLGTLSQLIEDETLITDKINGSLDAIDADNTENNTVIYTIALKMSESAGNDYQEKNLLSNFAVQVLASQKTSEIDSIDKNYDNDATYPS